MDDTQKTDDVIEEVKEEVVEKTPSEEAKTEEAPEEVKAEEKPAEEVKEKPKSEEKAEEPKKAVKAVSKDLEKIIESIEKLSVIELAELVHALEDKFGVSAAAPMGVAAAPAGTAANAEPQEEKTTFNVILTSGGANKIGAIKAVREIVPTLGLKEAKDLVEAAPKPVLESVNKTTAEEAKAKLTAAGATVELQ
jgi:large subunit ribosomal protein L7/L12